MNDKRLLQLQALVASDPDDPFLHYAIAQEFSAVENWTEAANRLTELASKFPDYLPTYYQLGIALVHSAELEKALGFLQTGHTLAHRLKDGKTANELAALIEEVEDML